MTISLRQEEKGGLVRKRKGLRARFSILCQKRKNDKKAPTVKGEGVNMLPGVLCRSKKCHRTGGDISGEKKNETPRGGLGTHRPGQGKGAEFLKEKRRIYRKKK